MQILVEVEGESVTLLPSRQEELMLITASLTSVENLFEHGKCTGVAPAVGTQIKMKLTRSIEHQARAVFGIWVRRRMEVIVDTAVWTYHGIS